ncbi:hypothetical protein GGP86_001429 [Salinibacter ruber]|uniref:O-antigen ligase family protein n=1 Tax=Salinibacter ruber TaxID=146919 RepID=UPI002169B479|nr:O-antigen ligase family protein [Salinibacter ruber]MCS3861651.1 hypothetical protein [Salinibacter ruber]
MALGITAALTGNAIASADPEKFVDFVAFFGGVAGYFLIAERYPLRVRDILTFVGIALGAGILIHVVGAPGVQGEFDLIPFVGENWRVIIRSPHFTGRSGLFLLFASLLFSREKGWRLWYVVLLGLSLYLIVFSGSRSSVAAALAILGLWYLKPVQQLVMRSWVVGALIPILAGLTMYLAPVLVFQSLTAEGFLGTLLQISPQQEDVTSGRLLTWLYHLDLFMNNFWTGAPVSAVVETGENIPLELRGSNESFFTKVLATQGVFGFLFYSLFLYLSVFSLKKKVYTSYILSVVFVVVTSSAGIYGSTYSLYSILGYWLYFSLISRSNK